MTQNHCLPSTLFSNLFTQTADRHVRYRKTMAEKQKLNLIEELTTHKCDYQIWPLHPVQPNINPRPREEPAIPPPPQSFQIDPQSHALYSPSVYVPFDLYLAPKPIVNKDPRECFNLEKPPKYTTIGEKVKLSTILPPALPLDEVENEEDLQKILDYTYKGLHKVLMEEAALKKTRQRVPPNRVAVEGSDLRFKSELYPPLPPGWIAAAKHWDCLQSRNLGDPFKSFWSRRGPEIECSCCCNPIPKMLPEETKEYIGKLVMENNLRLPYDATKTGYGGYRTMCAKGVPLEKSK